jgi:hypothetical protein
LYQEKSGNPGWSKPSRKSEVENCAEFWAKSVLRVHAPRREALFLWISAFKAIFQLPRQAGKDLFGFHLFFHPPSIALPGLSGFYGGPWHVVAQIFVLSLTSLSGKSHQHPESTLSCRPT